MVKEELRVPTRPVAPKLATAEREAKRKQMEKTQEQPGFVFKAQDLPKGMLEGVKVPICLLHYSTGAVPVGQCTPSYSIIHDIVTFSRHDVEGA